jgi:hypothetical protein
MTNLFCFTLHQARLRCGRTLIRVVSLLVSLGFGIGAAATPARITIGSDQIILLDGKPVFPIGFTKAPAPDAKTPSGVSAYKELKSNGTVFHLAGPQPRKWGQEAEAELDRILKSSSEAGLLVAISIPDLQAIRPADQRKADELRRVVEKYRNNSGLGFWKASDEPEWGKVPVADVQRYYDIVRQLDSNHPVWLTQAPRGTVDGLKAYNSGYDIGAIDIYPISYPPGSHSLLSNKEISMVGDYAKELETVTEGKKPFYMTLQICWSGVTRPGKTLRFPTLPQERYMAYQAIIDGARGLIFFGGNVDACLNDRDRPLGWNWTFYDRVLKPVLGELNPAGPLYPALVAPESKVPLKVRDARDLEFAVREAGGYIYVLAAKREGATVQVEFSGLPSDISTGDVLFENPRNVSVAGGTFTDWFGPNEVHVYRFREGAERASRQ